ncbi:hypothetical protein J437_LFUL010389 [Ladona fulva]|uniref:Uncharacterized protein n=1 Tax=Ladona fulva TaxID=123851 RepID=A0A8K0KHC1_LADFU|nr:hypothetical protein J437_LFUL010389 [Ladona fulva]
MLERASSVDGPNCPLASGLDLSLVPWPGMRYACIRVLHLYCKVFNQQELYELIIRRTHSFTIPSSLIGRISGLIRRGKCRCECFTAERGARKHKESYCAYLTMGKLAE